MTAGAILAESGVPSYYPLDRFGHDIWWLIIIKVVAIFAFLVLSTLFMILAERRVIGRMQQRIGPNRVGPFGSLQSLADGIKLALKEDIVPALADKPVFIIAPAISVTAAFLAFAVIPVGGVVSIAGHRTALQITDLPVAVLYVLACSAFGVYGIVLAGWSSGSTYPLLGGLRSAAQVISYEVAMGLSLVTVFLYSGSLSTSQIVAAQNQSHGAWWHQLFGWNFFPLLPAMIIYAIAAVGETNRAPFDLPEAEGELVGGFHTEYSSLKFALFFLAEYINMTTVSALATTLFLGGWRPFPIPGISNLVGWWGLLWFAIKLFSILFVFIWLRGTLPRLRYDQFMKLGWKVLVPASVVWLLLVATVKTARANWDSRELLLYGGGVLVIILLAVALWPSRAQGPDPEEQALAGFDTTGTFPVPTLEALLADRALTPVAVTGGPVTEARSVEAGIGTATSGPSSTSPAEESDRA